MKAGNDAVTVNTKLCVASPDTLDPVTVYVVANCAPVGRPDSAPVEVLNVIPAGAAGLIEKLEIALPVDFTVNPATEPFTTVWL